MRTHRSSARTVIAIAGLAAALPFMMAPTPLNVAIDGHPGGSEKEGREGTSDVFEFRHSLSQPFDPATGSPTGPRQHSPLRVVKVIDKASPGLHKALAQGETMDKVRVDFYRIDPATRTEEVYYTITLTDARIVDIQTFMPTSFLPENESYRHMEQVTFVYGKITWDWLPDDIQATDTWVSAQPQ